MRFSLLVFMTFYTAILSAQTNKQENCVFPICPDIYPSFPGGIESMIDYIKHSIYYPKRAIKREWEDSIKVMVNIDANGRVTMFRVVQFSHKSLLKVSLKAIRKMPTWIPGTRGGMPIEMHELITIKFRFD